MNDDWLKHIHDTMSDFETDEPENLWEAIESGLPTSTRARKSFFRPWMRYAAAAVLCALVALPVYLAINSGSDYNATPLRFARYYPEKSALLAMPEIKFIAKASDAPKNTYTPTATEKPTAYTETQELRNDSTPAVVNEKEETIEPEPSVRQESRNRNIDRSHPDNYNNFYKNTAHRKRKSTQGRLSISLAASSGAGTLFAQNSGSPQQPLHSSSNGIAWYDSPTLGMLVSTKGGKSETEYKHKQPVKTGLSFMYAINDRLSIGSGLTYSYPASDIKVTIGTSSLKGSQKLHYIGVPVNVRYRIASLSRFDFYATGGGAVEKCISARRETREFSDGTKNNQNIEGKLPRPYQFSVTAAAGVQYNVSSLFGIYAEPGMSYYFDDGSKLKTFYKDKPFNFSFDFGLRFTFE